MGRPVVETAGPLTISKDSYRAEALQYLFLRCPSDLIVYNYICFVIDKGQLKLGFPGWISVVVGYLSSEGFFVHSTQAAYLPGSRLRNQEVN